MPFTTELVGASGGAQFTGSDYTDPAVTQPFMNFFSDLFKIANSTAADPSPIQASDLQEDLIQLLNIAKNGISVQNQAVGKSVTYYMTAQMTDSLNQALKSLQGGGISDLPNITQAQLENWQASVQPGNITGLRFNQGLFNIFYYVANNFSGSKVSLNPANQGTELATALTKNTNGDVVISPYAARSLQAMTEVDYVNEGNNLINDTLTSMYAALNITKSVIDNLTTLQDLHNELKVVNRQDNITYTRNDIATNPLLYQQKYESSMSTFTNNLIPQLTEEYSPWLFPGATIEYIAPTGPSTGGPDSSTVTVWVTIPASAGPFQVINPIDQTVQTVTTEIKFGGSMLLPIPYTDFPNPPTAAFKARLASLLAYQKPSEYSAVAGSLESLAPRGIWPLITTQSEADKITARLTAAKTAFSAQVAALFAAAGTDPNSSTYKDIIDEPQSLYNLSRIVLEDLTDVGNLANYAEARLWVMDNYQAFNTTDATKAGAFQQRMTAAVTAAQATNDEQKETVRNNLFLFEEFYKSASTVLTQLNQIIAKMAQNIAR